MATGCCARRTGKAGVQVEAPERQKEEGQALGKEPAVPIASEQLEQFPFGILGCVGKKPHSFRWF